MAGPPQAVLRFEERAGRWPGAHPIPMHALVLLARYFAHPTGQLRRPEEVARALRFDTNGADICRHRAWRLPPTAIWASWAGTLISADSSRLPSKLVSRRATWGPMKARPGAGVRGGRTSAVVVAFARRETPAVRQWRRSGGRWFRSSSLASRAGLAFSAQTRVTRANRGRFWGPKVLDGRLMGSNYAGDDIAQIKKISYA